MQPQYSQMGFAQDLLKNIHMDNIISELKSLSTEVVLNKKFNKVEYSDEHGKVFVSEMTVFYEKNQLRVNQRVSFFLE